MIITVCPLSFVRDLLSKVFCQEVLSGSTSIIRGLFVGDLLSGGFVRRFCQEVLSGGFVRRFCQEVLSGGFVRRFCQEVLSGGFVRRFCQEVLSGGFVRRFCEEILSGSTSIIRGVFVRDLLLMGLLSGVFCQGSIVNFCQRVLSWDFCESFLSGGFVLGFLSM